MEVSLEILHGRLKSGAGVQRIGAFTIRQRRFVIGRDPDCNMVCKSRLISPRHCEITLSDRAATLEDLNSEHGTFVNGIRIAGQKPLRTGDLLVIGRLEFFVSVVSDQNTSTPDHEADPPERTAFTNTDTLALSAPNSDTVGDMPKPAGPAERKEGIDDLVSELLMEADEQDRELRMNDPAARYLRVESPDSSSIEADELEPAPHSGASNRQNFKRPLRNRPIKLPADKLPQPPSITGKDSVNAAEKALEELLRPTKKKR
ncbi:MAG: FHA domain-containing protein [Planctomycetaceae bacterium]|nr:FHA domain-containing protein [Planctomycetales bacterium]MCB9939673.1 FHA domain-containing protein [Planctomycetaceae bacterium]